MEDCAVCGREADMTCDDCGSPLCGEHVESSPVGGADVCADRSACEQRCEDGMGYDVGDDEDEE